MSSDFFNLRNCYDQFTDPNQWENPNQCVDSIQWLNRKIVGESLELFNINVLLGNPSYSNQCSVSPIWLDWYAQARIAVFGVLLLFYLFVIPVLCIRARRNSHKAGRIVSLFGYGLGVICVVAYLVIALIADTFLNCIKIGDEDYFKLFVACNIFNNAANVIILGVILLPLVRRVMHHGGYGAAFPTIVHLLLLVIVIALFVVAIVLYNLATVSAFMGLDVIDNNYIAGAIYVTFYLIAALSGGFWINHSVSGMWKNGRSTRGITPWANLLAFAFVLYACIPVVLIYGWKVHFMMYTRVASFAFVTVGLLMQALIYALVALVAGGRGLAQSPRPSPKLKAATPPPEIPPIVLDRGVHDDDYLRGTPLDDEERAIGSRRHSRRSASAYPTHTVDEKRRVDHHEEDEDEDEDEDDYEDIDDDDSDEISSIHSSDIDDISSIHTGDSEIHSHHGSHGEVSRLGSSGGSHTDVDEISTPAAGGGALNSHPTGRFREHVEDGTVKYA